MSAGWITSGNFDPHAEEIDGPASDPWAPTVRPERDPDPDAPSKPKISAKAAWRLADLSGLIILAIVTAIALVAVPAWQDGVIP